MPAGHKNGDAYNIIYKLFTHAIVVYCPAALEFLSRSAKIARQTDDGLGKNLFTGSVECAIFFCGQPSHAQLSAIACG